MVAMSMKILGEIIMSKTGIVLKFGKCNSFTYTKLLKFVYFHGKIIYL